MSFGLVHDVRRQVLVARVGDEGPEPRGCVDCHGCRRSACSTRDCAYARPECVEGLRRHGAFQEWLTLALLRRRANASVTTALPGLARVVRVRSFPRSSVYCNRSEMHLLLAGGAHCQMGLQACAGA